MQSSALQTVRRSAAPGGAVRVAAVAILLAACMPGRTGQPTTIAGARPESFDALTARIQRRIATVPGAVVGIAYRDLQTGDTLYINADTSFHAASTMKVPVMIELFRAFDSGKLRPDQRIVLGNEFKSIVDGSPYSLDAGSDSDSLVYTKVGSEITILELIDRMITRSSNLATNTVIELVGARNATATAHALGARNMRVLRGVEDSKAFQAGLNNSTTARDLAVLLAALETNTAASPASSRSMREILLRQEFNGEIPAGLPAGTPVAHKTGFITGVLHDAAIVYPERRKPYILVVLTRGIPEQAVAREMIVDVSRLVYAHATRR
jgi:beta-lactamase class A